MKRPIDEQGKTEKWLRKWGYLIIGVAITGFALYRIFNDKTVAFDESGEPMSVRPEETSWYPWMMLVSGVWVIILGIREWRYIRD